MNNFIKILIPLLSGLTTLFGTLPIYIKNNKNIISNSLFLSAGIMLTLSIFQLIPESLNYLKNVKTFEKLIILLIHMNIGIIISKYINKYIEKKTSNNTLYKVGISSLITLIIHNIPEGIITYITTNKNIKLGIPIAIAIAIHNIPEGISIAVPIYYSTKSKRKAIILTLISGFSELFGAIVAALFINNYFNNKLMFSILSITAGIMIHISITELIKEGLKYKSKQKCLYFIIGIILMLLVIFIFKI